MRILILLFLLLLTTKSFAGNTLPLMQFSGGGKKSPYIFTEEPYVLFDNDISPHAIERAMIILNDDLKDIQLDYEISETDFDHSTEVKDIWRSPNRFFVHNGRGWFPSGFSANLYVTEGAGTCLVVLNKKIFDTLPLHAQSGIMRHELMHCLRWAHSFKTSNLNHHDNEEVLLKLYDKSNKKGACHVSIVKEPEQRVDFIRNKRRDQYSVATKDNTVRLFPGRYEVKVDGKTYKKKFRCYQESKALKISN